MSSFEIPLPGPAATHTVNSLQWPSAMLKQPSDTFSLSLSLRWFFCICHASNGKTTGKSKGSFLHGLIGLCMPEPPDPVQQKVSKYYFKCDTGLSSIFLMQLSMLGESGFWALFFFQTWTEIKCRFMKCCPFKPNQNPRLKFQRKDVHSRRLLHLKPSFAIRLRNNLNIHQPGPLPGSCCK